MNACDRLFPRASLRTYVFALVFVLVIPMFALSAMLLLEIQSQEQAILNRRIAREAQSISASVAGRIHDMNITLQVLASAPEVQSGNLQLYHDRTQEALVSGSWFLIMVDKTGQQLFNTRVPFGTELGKTSNLKALEAALARNGPLVSDGFLGVTSGKWVFNVILPIQDTDVPVNGALILTQDAQDFLPVITPSDLPAGWHTALIDGAGRVVAAASGFAPGAAFPADMLRYMGEPSGTVRGPAGSNSDIMAFAQVHDTGWAAVVWGPASAGRLDTGPAWSRLVAGSAAVLAIALLAAYMVSRRLRRAGSGIVDMARRVGAGQLVESADTGVTEANLVANALAAASTRRKAAEDHGRLVTRELAHRIKNLLSVVQAMTFQASRQTQSVEVLSASLSSRLAGLGRSIDLLTGAEWGGVALRELVESQLSIFDVRPAGLAVSGPDVLLRADAVQNLGLVLHELATNAMKFGAFSTPGGRVAVTWSLSGEGAEALVEMHWVESGGPEVSPPDRKGFGTTVIELHAASAFHGKVTLDYARGGLHWTLRAPLSSFVVTAKGTE